MPAGFDLTFAGVYQRTIVLPTSTIKIRFGNCRAKEYASRIASNTRAGVQPYNLIHVKLPAILNAF